MARVGDELLLHRQMILTFLVHHHDLRATMSAIAHVINATWRNKKKKREKYCGLTSDLRRQIHQLANLSLIERSQHDDCAIVFLAPWKAELLDGFLVDKSAGESGAAAASDAEIAGLVIQVLDVVMVPGVAGAGPVVASGERPVTVARGGRGNHHVVRVAVVESVLPDWRGTGRGIGESRGVVDDQWPR